jgi:hypothetical protein
MSRNGVPGRPRGDRPRWRGWQRARLPPARRSGSPRRSPAAWAAPTHLATVFRSLPVSGAMAPRPFPDRTGAALREFPPWSAVTTVQLRRQAGGMILKTRRRKDSENRHGAKSLLLVSSVRTPIVRPPIGTSPPPPRSDDARSRIARPDVSDLGAVGKTMYDRECRKPTFEIPRLGQLGGAAERGVVPSARGNVAVSVRPRRLDDEPVGDPWPLYTGVVER